MNKICTFIKQSQKLIKLGIDVKNADMFWDMAEPDKRRKPSVGPISDYYDVEDWAVPAWSLTALLSVLPFHFIVDNQRYAFSMIKGLDKNGETYAIKYTIFNTTFYFHLTDFYSNPVDACVEMIIKLHKQKLL